MSGSSAAEGIRAVPLGAWLELVATRGWGDDRVWLLVQDAARAALPAVRRSLRPGEDEELVSDVLTLARSLPDSWRRSDRAQVGLVRWLAGVLKRRLRALRRGEFLTTGEQVAEFAAAPVVPHEPEDADASAARLAEAAALLTEKQLAAFTLACRGLTHSEAANELGISRDAQRDRLRRAKKRLAAGVPAPQPHDPAETARLATRVAERGDTVNATLLVLRSIGKGYAACARALRISVEAVRSRIARMWRVWKTSLDPKPCDTSLPPAALPTEGRVSTPPEGVLDDGNAHVPLARRCPLRPGARQRGRDPP